VGRRTGDGGRDKRVLRGKRIGNPRIGANLHESRERVMREIMGEVSKELRAV
jgi:hypothetical protein